MMLMMLLGNDNHLDFAVVQGRFFAGRMVRVSFFPEERFTSTDLAPKAGEFD